MRGIWRLNDADIPWSVRTLNGMAFDENGVPFRYTYHINDITFGLDVVQ